MRAHNLHKHACLAGRHFTDGMMNAHGETMKLLDRPCCKITQSLLRERTVGFILQTYEFAMCRMILGARPAKENALGAGRLRERLKRRILHGVIQQLHIKLRLGRAHMNIVADSAGMHVLHVIKTGERVGPSRTGPPAGLAKFTQHP